MKFLFVDASSRGWGMEQHFVALASGLAQAQQPVTAIVQRDGHSHRLLLDSGVRVIPKRIRGGGDPRLLSTLLEIISNDRPDWLVANQSRMYWPLALLGRMTGVRVALFRHLVDIKQWSTRTLLPRVVDRFFVASDYARNELVRHGAPADHVTRLYNPIDIRRFKPDPEARWQVRNSLGLSDREILFGIAGRVEMAKGIGVMRAAACDLMDIRPDVRVVCLGEGSDSMGTRRFVRDRGHGDKFFFPGWRADIERFIAASDVMLMPSISIETFGRVCAEAQACEVPVIASALAGLPEAMLPGSSGLLITPGDEDQLREAMLALTDDADRRIQMGKIGREYVRNRYSCETICAEFISLLEGRGLTTPTRSTSTTAVAR